MYTYIFGPLVHLKDQNARAYFELKCGNYNCIDPKLHWQILKGNN